VSLDRPLGLLALLVVPVALAAYLLLQRRRMRYGIRFTNLEVLAAVAGERRPWRRYVPPALFLLALAALALGMARPQISTTVPREDATIVLLVDTSGSMFAEDVKPTRLEAARQAITRFLERLPDRYRVGMVSFSGEANVVAPPTEDRELVRTSLTYLFPERGTAVGDGLSRAVALGRQAVAPGTAGAGAAGREDDELVAILMLSDGAQTTGFLSPLDGARRARQARIPVYTIALGTPDGVIELDFGGGVERVIPVPPDPETMRRIARMTGGEFHDAPDAEALGAVYERLRSRVSGRPGEREVTFGLLAVGAGLLLGAGVLSGLWSSRIP
jgi:Ca-activated chloride channel family protein